MLAHGIPCDVYTYTILIGSAADRGAYESVHALLTQMVRERVPITHYCWRIATAPLGRARDCDGVKDVIDCVRAAGARPDLAMWRDYIGTYPLFTCLSRPYIAPI